MSNRTKFSLGFLANSKKINTAKIRSKTLLILAGNQIILSKDPIWSQFLKLCSDKTGCTGVQHGVLNDIDEMEFTKSFSNLNMNEPPPREGVGRGPCISRQRQNGDLNTNLSSECLQRTS